jgi:type II restriction/modification system DNA methylase subunit YeeA
MLSSPNPHGKPNSDVILPFANASDLAGRLRGWSIIDFGQRSAEEAALYEIPFEYVKKHVKPLRDHNRDAQRKRFWWRHGRSGSDLKAALAGKRRQIATPRVSKYRVFIWLDAQTVVSDAVVAFARTDDYFFGVLHSRVHEVWARSTGTQLREAESGFRYTPTTCFETFPFPNGTQNDQWAISLAAKDLNELRENWLNPKEMIGAKELRKRSLTELYNKQLSWLADAHRALDQAVFRAYGWRERPDELPDGEIIGRLLALNLGRTSA